MNIILSSQIKLFKSTFTWVSSNRFEISNRFEMLFRLHGNLHGDFTAATFQTIERHYCTCANDIF